MRLNISQHDKEGITILELKGTWWLAKPSPCCVTRCPPGGPGPRNVILNLEGVDYIDSTAWAPW